MKRIQSLLLMFFLVLLFACVGDGKSAQDTMFVCANALESNNSSLFLAQFDLKACASNKIKDVTDSNEALYSLDKLGKSLGIGGMEDLLGNIVDVEHSLRQQLGKKSSTGELARECTRSEKTGCPWVPASLRQADIRVVSKTAAVARVVSPTKLTTWIALAKRGENWLIVGWSDLEDSAKAFATQGEKPQGDTGKKAPQKNKVEL